MVERRRLPSDLLWPLGWCLLMGVLWVFLSLRSASLALKLTYGALGTLYIVSALSLFRLRNWARIAVGVLFGIGAALSLIAIWMKGLSLTTGGRLAMNAWWSAYMFLPSTRQLFATSVDARFSAPGCITQALLLVAMGLAFGLSLALGLPKWTTVVGPLAVLVVLAFFESRMERALGALLARRPAELEPAAWKTFREVRRLRSQREFDAAGALLDSLPDVACVRTLRALFALDRIGTADPLTRVLLEAGYYPPEEARATIAARIRETGEGLERMIQGRADHIDALLEDSVRASPLFTGEHDRALERLTGRFFVNNAEFQHRQAWQEARPACTGTRARIWLTVRLWERGAHEAAAEAAKGGPDPLVREAAQLACRAAEASKGLSSPEWVQQHVHSIVVFPLLADGMRLLFLDLPFMSALGPGVVASRLRLRLELIARLRRLRDEYPGEADIWVALMISLLASHPKGFVRKKARLDAWWSACRDAQVRFDTSFTEGLEAALKGDWAGAERAFGEAATAWPERSCAPYNRALSLLHIERHSDAEAAFRVLAEAEPEEPLFWMRLGDACRAGGRTRDALGAYRRAARLGKLEEEVALRLGLTLAEQGRDDEAIKALEATAGPEPDAGTLDQLADFLESEGVYRLSHHYRQKAMERRLTEEAPPEPGETDEDAPASA